MKIDQEAKKLFSSLGRLSWKKRQKMYSSERLRQMMAEMARSKKGMKYRKKLSTTPTIAKG